MIWQCIVTLAHLVCRFHFAVQGMNSVVNQCVKFACAIACQEHLQAIEQELQNDAQEESALHKRAAAIQKAAKEVARLAPEASSSAQEMADEEVDTQVAALSVPVIYSQYLREQSS